MGRLHLDIKYTPKQLECRAALEDHSIVLYGGAKGGGKSFVARCLAVEYAFKYPGIYVAIFRRSFPELEANHIRPILQQFPVLKEFYKVGRKLIELDNGSVIEFCFCDHEDHLDKYQGREIQFLIIEEAGQFPQSWIARLSGSNRTSNPRIPARLLMTGNPGGISHAYLKRLFVDRNYLPHERPEDHYFIQATIASNPALEKADPNYRRRLEAEPNEALRRAFLYGEWDLFAGQFFPDFSPDVHIIPDFDEDNPMPSHWMRFGAYDHGYYHPAAFGWFAVDEDENVYMYREFLTRKQRPDEILEEL
ncbi:MAG: phage terminase large subunit, partial [Flavobacteriales bacterium]